MHLSKAEIAAKQIKKINTLMANMHAQLVKVVSLGILIATQLVMVVKYQYTVIAVKMEHLFAVQMGSFAQMETKIRVNYLYIFNREIKI